MGMQLFGLLWIEVFHFQVCEPKRGLVVDHGYGIGSYKNGSTGTAVCKPSVGKADTG